jgi:hypothetical protein
MAWTGDSCVQCLDRVRRRWIMGRSIFKEEMIPLADMIQNMIE